MSAGDTTPSGEVAAQVVTADTPAEAPVEAALPSGVQREAPKVWATVRYEDDALTVTLAASAGYGSRGLRATVGRDLVADEHPTEFGIIAKALAALIGQVGDDLIDDAQGAAGEARAVARQRGEL